MNVPGAGLTLPKQKGLTARRQRFQNSDGTH